MQWLKRKRGIQAWREGGPQVLLVVREEGSGTVDACIGMIRKRDVLAQWGAVPTWWVLEEGVVMMRWVLLEGGLLAWLLLREGDVMTKWVLGEEDVVVQ